MTDEYIRKQDAIDTFNRAVQDVGILDADDIETVFRMLSSADVVPVVRCKDCKQFRRWVNTDIEFCDLTESTVFGDDFCSRGERGE